MMNGNPKAHQEYNGVMSMHVDTEMMIDFKESGLGGVGRRPSTASLQDSELAARF